MVPTVSLASGKPPKKGGLTFNLSHSGRLGLVAVTHRREIGVDIEEMRSDLSIKMIAERFFSRREIAMLAALPQARRLEGFFNCWTRKEAFLKARGEGLGMPLNRFSVSLAPDDPALLLEMQACPTEVERWSLFGFQPAAGFVAALAVEGQIRELKCWDLPADSA
jgi:4'-phosphopantetheinyl transferase